MRHRRFTGATRAMLNPAEIVKNGPPPAELAGRPARCTSDVHPDRQATVWGTFQPGVVRRGAADVPNVGYCPTCAYFLYVAGLFRPDNQDDIPGEE